MAAESGRPGSLRPTRRTEGIRVQGRSARVVEAVLTAVGEELGQVGYAALRIEDVAARSGVNKTTIYRRWPTKSELVIAAVDQLTEDPENVDTGALRSDLLKLIDDLQARVEQPVTRGLIRMIQAERADPEVSAIVRGMRARHLAVRRAIFDRAIARGEIPAGSDALLLVELTMAPLFARLVHLQIPVDEEFLRTLVDTIVAGARAGAAVHSR